MNVRAVGMSLVELIVALTLLSVGVLGLAAAAAVAQRSFASAEAVERAARAAAAVLDSLMHEPVASDGRRLIDGVDVTWLVQPDSGTSSISLTVSVHDGGRSHELRWHAVHSARPER